MSELQLHNKPIETIFELLGKKENNITYSVGWALYRSPAFLKQFIKEAMGVKDSKHATQLRLQHFHRKKGITDIEILCPNAFHVIVEAKCGWYLPEYRQLEKYAFRFKKSDEGSRRKIVVLSECSGEYAKGQLQAHKIRGVPIESLSWKSLNQMITAALRSGSNAEKRLLRELRAYLGKVTKMQDIYSNEVFVVSLGRGTHPGWKISWADIVRERRRYFHKMGVNGWPKEPPNYIAFRYKGKLMSIHHVDGYDVCTNLHEYFREIPSKKRVPYFVYKLGRAIKPARDIPSGAVYANGRIWCMFDTLFTSKTVAHALRLSNKRRKTAKKNS
jgi:hypothetical protein